ncbi:30S ribosomal protein S7 [bacterium]|nr:30S ribosomal protein S7 [bacterium]
MPRKGPVPKRDIPPDLVYQSKLVAKFINKVMLNGKKTKAEKIVYTALKNLEERLGKSGAEILEQAIENVRPLVAVRPRRVGGATYQVPMEVDPDKGRAMAMKWIIEAFRSRNGKSAIEKLTAELLDAYNKVGTAIKKREDTHKMAEANRAFSHYRW